MNIQNVTMNSTNRSNNYNKSNTSFKATPKQILSALDTAELKVNEKDFLKDMAELFGRIETGLKADSFTYKLGENNNMSSDIAPLSVRTFFEGVDEGLNEETNSLSKYNVNTIAQLVKKLLTDMNVEEPGVITFKKPS